MDIKIKWEPPILFLPLEVTLLVSRDFIFVNLRSPTSILAILWEREPEGWYVQHKGLYMNEGETPFPFPLKNKVERQIAEGWWRQNYTVTFPICDESTHPFD